jgi:hypothetical protein
LTVYENSFDPGTIHAAHPSSMTTASGWRRLVRYSLSGGVPARSLRVAVVVGTALNLINQGDAIFGPAPVHWLKLMLTFIMPYAVSTYGAVAMRMRMRDDRTGKPET